MRRLVTLTLIGVTLLPPAALASPEQEVGAGFARFVAAQNAHDLSAVRELLLPDPTFVWVTRGKVIWGAEAALERFQGLYAGTWSLSPRSDSLRVVMHGEAVAQLVCSVTFTIGPPGQPAVDTPFILTQTWIKTSSGWKVGSLLPIPVPAAAPAVESSQTAVSR